MFEFKELQIATPYFELPVLKPEIDKTKNFFDVGALIRVLLSKNRIKSITANEVKGITTVVFENGEVRMAKTYKGDKYDANIGVALCLAYNDFGSKTKFKKMVKDNATTISKQIKKEKSVKEIENGIKN